MFSANIVIGLLLVAASICLINVTRGFPEAFVYKQAGPGLWPTLVLFGLIVCGLLHVFRSPEAAKMLKLSDRGKKEREVTTEKEDVQAKNIVMLLAMISLMALMIWVSSKAGFIITAPPVIFLMMLVLGARRIPSAMVVSLGITAVIVFLFVYLMGAHLPKGAGIFREVNVFFSFQ